MTNINGKAYAMNTISPMKPWKTPLLRLVFWAVGAIPQLRKGLLELSFIHFARWVIVTRHGFPRVNDRQPRENLRYDYLLFFSNFNGSWNQYIDAFSDVLSSGLDLIWGWSVKFPLAKPITPFKEFVQRIQFDTDFYYTAHPYAATNDVKAALRVQSAYDAFAASPAAASPSPEKFAAAYQSFMAQVQRDIGSTGPGPIGT